WVRPSPVPSPSRLDSSRSCRAGGFMESRDNGASAVIARIQASLQALSQAEGRVAQAVLRDPEGTVYASVTELAEASGVGETTVLRFVRRLGYRSYQAFKIDLARDLSAATQGAHQDQTPQEN